MAFSVCVWFKDKRYLTKDSGMVLSSLPNRASRYDLKEVWELATSNSEAMLNLMPRRSIGLEIGVLWFAARLQAMIAIDCPSALLSLQYTNIATDY